MLEQINILVLVVSYICIGFLIIIAGIYTDDSVKLLKNGIGVFNKIVLNSYPKFALT